MIEKPFSDLLTMALDIAQREYEGTLGRLLTAGAKADGVAVSELNRPDVQRRVWLLADVDSKAVP